MCTVPQRTGVLSQNSYGIDGSEVTFSNLGRAVVLLNDILRSGINIMVIRNSDVQTEDNFSSI